MKKFRPKNNLQRAKGFAHVSSFVKRYLTTTNERQNFATTRLTSHWVEMVGEEIASMSEPVDLFFDHRNEEVTLTLLSTSVYAEMVRMSIPNILERINSAYGFKAVGRIKVTQTWKGQRAQSKSQHDRPAKVKKQTPATEMLIPKSLTDIEDDQLRDSLIELHRSISAQEDSYEKDSK